MSNLPATREETQIESGLRHLALLEGAGAITEIGLVQSKLMELSYEEYEALGAMFGHLERATIWMIGDWLNLGEKLYGDDFYQAAEALNLRPQTLTNRRSICSRIPRSRRIPGVPFSTHAEVAYLAPKEQERWLKEAVRQGWSARRLREEIKNETGEEHDALPSTVEDDQEVLCTCETCGHVHPIREASR